MYFDVLGLDRFAYTGKERPQSRFPRSFNTRARETNRLRPIVSSQFSSETFVILHPCSSHNLPNYMTRVHHGFLSYFPSSLFLSSPFFPSSSLSLTKSFVFFAASFLFTFISLVIFKYALISILIPFHPIVSILTHNIAFPSARYSQIYVPDSFFLLIQLVDTSLSSHLNPIWNAIQSPSFESPWIKQMVNMIRECHTLLEWPVINRLVFTSFLVVVVLSCYSALFSIRDAINDGIVCERYPGDDVAGQAGLGVHRSSRYQGKITQRLFRVYSNTSLLPCFSLLSLVSRFPIIWPTLRPSSLSFHYICFSCFRSASWLFYRLVVKRAAVARSSSTKKEESIYCTATHIRVRAQSIAAASFEISKEAQTQEHIHKCETNASWSNTRHGRRSN